MILATYPDVPASAIHERKGFKFIGYWRDTAICLPGSLPWPKFFVDKTWDAEERAKVIAYLKAGTHWEGWMGDSWCRFGCDREDDEVDMGGQSGACQLASLVAL